jgi:hypothetical protein
MRRTLALIAALFLVLAACGDDDGEVGTGDEPTTTTTSEPPPPIGEDPDEGDMDEGDDAIDPDADRPAYTDGVDFDPETGEVDVTAYQAFLAEHGGPSTGADTAAIEMLGPSYTEADLEMTTEPADGGRTVVIVVFDNLRDDSVAAHRFELVFVGDGDDLILESGSWASRCQPGRGHQEFSTGLCV